MLSNDVIIITNVTDGSGILLSLICIAATGSCSHFSYGKMVDVHDQLLPFALAQENYYIWRATSTEKQTFERIAALHAIFTATRRISLHPFRKAQFVASKWFRKLAY